MFALLAVSLGCKLRHPLVGMHCEAGVKDGVPQPGGHCVDIHEDGSLTIVSQYTKRYSYRPTSTKGRYDLVPEAKAVGFIEHDASDRWLYVTFLDDPSRRRGYRDDMPGFLY